MVGVEPRGELAGAGVEIAREPAERPRGVSALFTGLYGDVHQIVEPRHADTGVPDVA